MVHQAKRRRNQVPLEKLPLLARFLAHEVEQRAMTLEEFGERAGKASKSTASRWLRGAAPVTAADLERFSAALGIPLGTFSALQALEPLEGGPMVTTVGAWRHLIDGAERRVIAVGATMIAGFVQLLDILNDQPNSARPLLLASLGDPFVPGGPIVAQDASLPGTPQGTTRALWLASAMILIGLPKRWAGAHVRLWVRSTREVHVPGTATTFFGQIAANDFVAIVSPPAGERPSFSVVFRNTPRWSELVAPIQAHLESSVSAPGEELIWDSGWDVNDARHDRLWRRLEDTAAELGRCFRSSHREPA